MSENEAVSLKHESQIDLNIDHILADESLRRRLFPIATKRIFLAHAGVAPLPGLTIDALKHEADRAGIAQEGPDFLADVEAIRRIGARLINATSHEIALLGPTSLGLNLVANGLDWQPNDEVVFYPDDYPANVYPWQTLAGRGVRVIPLQPERLGEITPELVTKALTPRTRLVALASCHFLSGFRLDYEGIAEELNRRGILFCLDAIQSLGATTVDVRHIDFLAADSHKWMLGPLGAGIFYVKQKHFERLRPSLLGSWNVHSPGYIAQPEIVFENSARRYEPGSLNLLALHGMKASLELILGIGVKQIEARLLDLRALTEEKLAAAGFRVAGFANRRSQKSGITTIVLEDQERAMALARKLRDRHVDISLRQTRAGLSCLRFSPHFYNTEAEIEEAVKILLS
ncbi:MAG TPA: aminotransferase class V-fold PLP-dependent enzyme [Candidatus Methylacidiphilales bacterium]|nr:aminotransferase class V-fold PLP-dependent enzyme [Candidatus Methylacidiphilales bacterium]